MYFSQAQGNQFHLKMIKLGSNNVEIYDLLKYETNCNCHKYWNKRNSHFALKPHQFNGYPFLNFISEAGDIYETTDEKYRLYNGKFSWTKIFTDFAIC